MLNRVSQITRLLPEFFNAAKYAAVTGKLGEYFSLVFRLLVTRIRGRASLPGYLESMIAPCDSSPPVVSLCLRYQRKSASPLVVKISGTNLGIDDVIDWDVATEDQENSFALHRFGWLLSGYIDDQISADDVVAIICDWIGHVPYQSSALGWDSYSISERLVNWILLLENIPPSILFSEHASEINRSIEIQADYLICRLEYRGADTNNHLINNARALYIVGCYLDNEEMRAIASTILGHESKRMFYDSGFLREGSSHYQLLLARTFLEIVWFARRANDQALLDKIEGRAKKIWYAASFFLQDKSFPVFGDLSPDFTPDFHFGVGYIGGILFDEKSISRMEASKGWYSIFTDADISTVSSDINSIKGLISYPDAGYYRYSNNNYTLYVYVNPMGYVPGWSHGHADIGNFILYWKDHPVFVGTGRSSYRDTREGRYGRSVRSHNTVAVDGCEPCVVHGLNGIPSAMSKDYLQSPPVVETTTEEGVDVITIVYGGMARWFEDGEVRREFRCLPDELVIYDSINGKGSHGITTYFQIAEEYQVECEGSSIVLMKENSVLYLECPDKTKLEIIEGRDGADPSGWYTSSYGELRPICTVSCCQTEALPVTNSFRISDKRAIN